MKSPESRLWNAYANECVDDIKAYINDEDASQEIKMDMLSAIRSLFDPRHVNRPMMEAAEVPIPGVLRGLRKLAGGSDRGRTCLKIMDFCEGEKR